MSSYQCHLCGQSFSRQQRLESHLKRKTPCIDMDTCSKIKISSKNLKLRKDIIACQFCGKTFARKDNLARHQQRFCREKKNISESTIEDKMAFLEKQIHELKDGRALHSVTYGADEKWASSYVQKDRPWAVLSPVANIVGILASFEAFKFMINREELRPVISPNLIQINFANQNMVQVSIPENGSWDYTTL